MDFIRVSDRVRTHYQDNPEVLESQLFELNTRIRQLLMSMAGRDVRFDYQNMPKLVIAEVGENV